MLIHTKRKHYVKRALLTLLIFVIAFSVLSIAAAAIFYGMFFTRHDTLPVYAVSYSDVDAASYPCRKIRFPSGDNTLTAYYYSCDDPAGLVVIATGFGESGAEHLAEAEFFVDSGFDVLCYDCTGVGESEGSSTVGLAQPSLDLHSALEYIAQGSEADGLPIYLYGHSAGGYAVAACMDVEQVHAAVILSGFESPTMLMRETARSYVGILADIEYPFLFLQNAIVFNGQGGQRASRLLSETDKPVAIFEGNDDRTVPASVRLSSYVDTQIHPNLTLSVCDEAPRNGHSGIWLSDDALVYRLTLTDDVYDADKSAANELDTDFMSGIVRFYKNAG